MTCAVTDSEPPAARQTGVPRETGTHAQDDIVERLPWRSVLAAERTDIGGDIGTDMVFVV